VEIIKKQVIVLNRLNFRWLSQIKNALTNDDSKLASEAGERLYYFTKAKTDKIEAELQKQYVALTQQKQHAVLISENGGNW
jgi:hypothetical protein